MFTPELHLVCPEQLNDFLQGGQLAGALNNVAELAGACLKIVAPQDAPGDSADLAHVPVQYRGRVMGSVLYPPQSNGSAISTGARTVGSLLEHMVDREIAVDDLAAALNISYEELNMLYTLLPMIATKTNAHEIGKALVEQTMRTLRCRRVSLLVVDETRKVLKVLASSGLPANVQDIHIPISDSIAGQVLLDDDLIVVNDISDRPDLARMSLGKYDSASFAVVRVPLNARGEAVGVLTVTERIDSAEFSARDHKLLEGLSAMGASALLNCRLHDAVNRQMIGTIQALASAVDAKDHYTHDHAGRVAGLCVATARELGITDPVACREVELAGLLHDIGKIGIADAILSKPGRLTPEEFAIIKSHVEIGARILEKVEGLEQVAKAVLHHHERIDGLGYPAGLSESEIPIASKLISVSDIFDSLTSDRPYRKALSNEAAVQTLKKSSGTQLDPDIVDAFLRVVLSNTEPTDTKGEEALADTTT
jgi:putative nucleotidyltransferase with HDIG domain